MSQVRAGMAVLVAGLVLSGCSLLGNDNPDSSSTPASPSASASQPSGDSASPSASIDPLAAFYDQRVRWEPCEGGFDCTKVKVPLDYSNPSGDVIELAVVRHKAKNSLGALVLNPGGPGGSGVDYARGGRAVVTNDVFKNYDLVGFDPRGVAASNPVNCVSDKELDKILAADGTPDSPAEEQEVADLQAQMGKGCLAKSPAIAAHMGTKDAARDMDILRAVLGEEKLNYLGKSYGTFLGAQYADLFPDRVGRMVLDGVLPSSLNGEQITLGQAKAFDVTLKRFVADCLPRKDCPLSGTVEQGVAQVADFLKSLEANPLPGVGSRKLNESLATYAVLSYLYFPLYGDWELLRYGLTVAMKEGDGSVLLDMVDDRLSRGSDGRYLDNGNEAFPAVSCLDRPGTGTPERAKQLAEEWSKEAPVFGAYMAWSNTVCDNWPLGDGKQDLSPLTAKGSDPILVVSTKYDPATPYEWGVQVAKELDNAKLLTYDADGHTAYTSGSTCVDNVVDQYLLDGKMPADGVVCKPDAQ